MNIDKIIKVSIIFQSLFAFPTIFALLAGMDTFAMVSGIGFASVLVMTMFTIGYVIYDEWITDKIANDQK